MLNEQNEKLFGIFDSFYEIQEKEEFIENIHLFYQAECQSNFHKEIHYFHLKKIKKVLKKPYLN